MASPRVYTTPSLDLCAFLVVLRDYQYSVTLDPGENRASFNIEYSPRLFEDIADYEAGGAVPAKRLLNARSRLFREASAVVRGGGR